MANKRDPYVTKRTIPFTNQELVVVFGVTLMTLHLWRQGTPTKTPLRTSKGRGREVRYPAKTTMEWARKNEVPIIVHPEDLGRTVPAPAAARRPGPKPRAAAVGQALLRAERPSAR